MYTVIYSENAREDLKKMEIIIVRRIIKKIHFFSQQEDINPFCIALKNIPKPGYIFRIGDYRAIFSQESDGQIKILKILRIRHRKEIYSDI